MDLILSKITQQAVNYAIRSGITITSGYAIKQCSRLLMSVKGNEKEELAALQSRLESKIPIISDAIEMIELIAARGNTSLESAVRLTKEIRREIQALGIRIAKVANEEELLRKGSSKAQPRAQTEHELKNVITAMRKLLERIEDAVPMINLSITTSGAKLSTALPSTVSISRLLQASAFLTAGDTRYSFTSEHIAQIGPAFTLSMYMLFAGHAHRPNSDESTRETTWKEVIHKARVKLLRVPIESVYDLPVAEHQTHGVCASRKPSAKHFPGAAKPDEFAYQLLIVEDLDDDRAHTFEKNEAQPGPFEDVAVAGVREVFPVHQVSKIFYADTGKILNIGADGDSHSPVLLLKRDVNAVPPRQAMETRDTETEWYDRPEGREEPRDSDSRDIGNEQSKVEAQFRRESSAAPNGEEGAHALEAGDWGLPPDLDPEWIAFEVYSDDTGSDSECELSPLEDDTSYQSSPEDSLDLPLRAALANLNLSPSPKSAEERPQDNRSLAFRMEPAGTPAVDSRLPVTGGPIRTSLSLLEMLLRLTSLQQFRQSSILCTYDEHLNFFLEESSNHEAGGDSTERRRVRRDARQRVGFDPYDESPIKRRGEEYQMHRSDYPQQMESPRGHSEHEGLRVLRETREPSTLPISEVSTPRYVHSASTGASSSPLSWLERGGPAETISQAQAPLQQFAAPATPPASAKSRTSFLRVASARQEKLSSPLGPGRLPSKVERSPSEAPFEDQSSER